MLANSDLIIRGTVLQDEPMSRHTSLKVGGPADYFAIPADTDDLAELLRQLHQQHIPWFTIGSGYNLLVRDKGIRGAVISLERCNGIEQISPTQIRAASGAENLAVVRFAQERGLGGVGFISGIPGTIGGALRMNAGAYGKGILDYVATLTLFRNGMAVELARDDIRYSYRHLELASGDIILGATLQLTETDPAITEQEIRQDFDLRRQKHAVGFPSAGSFFKNPTGETAWRLIDQAEMRGTHVGGAQVSEVHSNFLINRGGATAADFIALAALVKERVFACCGVQLEEEVRIVGEV